MKPRKPLPRSRKQIPRIGPRALRKRAQRRQVIEDVNLRDRVCQAQARIEDALGNLWNDLAAMQTIRAEVADSHPPRACGGRLDVHEIIPRSAWPDGELVESNCLLVCRRHHDWIDDNPEPAHLLGLHGFSWERP